MLTAEPPLPPELTRSENTYEVHYGAHGQWWQSLPPCDDLAATQEADRLCSLGYRAIVIAVEVRRCVKLDTARH